MPATPELLSPTVLDTSSVLYSLEDIEKTIPHRGPIRQLSGILRHDFAVGLIVGFVEVTDNQFWVDGHLPGRPLLPGALMIEAAAQLCAFDWKMRGDGREENSAMGLGGVDRVRFRGSVIPGQTLILVAQQRQLRSRKGIWEVQGYVDSKRVFEAEIIGMAV